MNQRVRSEAGDGVIRVVAADDSALMRRMIKDILATDPSIEVCGVARNGAEAVDMVDRLQPDVVVMDVEMLVMDGLEALQQIVARHPVAVVMFSAITTRDAEATIRALELGAVDFVLKPKGWGLESVRRELIEKVKMARGARRKRLRARPEAPTPGLRLPGTGQRVVAIGTSTGGPRALQEVVPRLPPSLPACVLVVQHMPPGFTRSLAERLNTLSKLPVREAEPGDPVRDGVVYIAPGGWHMVVGGDGRISLEDSPPIGGLRPAADITMRSTAEVYGPNVLGVVLTGIGHDGREGARAIKAKRGIVLAEHESTCVIYGMPRAVIEAGYADLVVPLDLVAAEIARIVAG